MKDSRMNYACKITIYFHFQQKKYDFFFKNSIYFTFQHDLFTFIHFFHDFVWWK